jgi:hypothetical protein
MIKNGDLRISVMISCIYFNIIRPGNMVERYPEVIQSATEPAAIYEK